MKRYIVSFFIIPFFIVGCSDSYESSLNDTPTTIDDVQNAIDDGKQTANDSGVTLSENTENKIADLQETINQIEEDLGSSTGSSIASTEVINQAIESISSVRADIEDSNISDEEKELALNQIDKIERDKLQDGLDALTQAIQTTEEESNNNCQDSISNMGALPPSLPSDDCL